MSSQEIVSAGTIMRDSLAFHAGVTFGVEIRLRPELQFGISHDGVSPVITLL